MSQPEEYSPKDLGMMEECEKLIVQKLKPLKPDIKFQRLFSDEKLTGDMLVKSFQKRLLVTSDYKCLYLKSDAPIPDEARVEQAFSAAPAELARDIVLFGFGLEGSAKSRADQMFEGPFVEMKMENESDEGLNRVKKLNIHNMAIDKIVEQVLGMDVVMEAKVDKKITGAYMYRPGSRADVFFDLTSKK